MDKWLQEIRKKISCPQLGDEHYGEWGALNFSQRRTIKRMLEYIDAQDKEIERLKAYIKNNGSGWGLVSHLEFCRNLKAEAYKECIEKAKEELCDWVGADNSISYSRITRVLDNLLKEMEGELNGTQPEASD